MNVRSLRVVFSRFSCTYVGYSNLSELGRNHLILGELWQKIEEENSSECSGEELGRRTPDAPGGLGRRARSAPRMSL